MPRKVTGNFFVINVKILSNDEVTPESYIELFRNLHRSKQTFKSSGSNFIIIRTMFESIQDDKPILMGRISKYTKIESDVWLNIKNLETTTYQIPEDFLPNLTETEYLFIPDAHRFVILNKSGTVSHKAALKFLESALNAVCDFDEEVHVSVETSEDFIEKILSAKYIQSLDIEISYTNQDLTSDFSEYVDNELRSANLNKLTIGARSKVDSSIELSQSPFLQGSTELAGSNGSASATIVNEEGKKEKVTTDQYPRKFPVIAETKESLLQNVVTEIRNVFRPN